MSRHNRGSYAAARIKEKAIQDELLKQGTKTIISFFVILCIYAFANSLLQ